MERHYYRRTAEDGNNNLLTSCCNDAQEKFLFLYILYLAIVLLIGDTILCKPIRLLATAVHEISHAQVCLLTGGNVHKMEVYNNTGGVTYYRGGCRCLIAPAGYLGEAFWGMIFTILSGGRRTATFAAGGLILALLLSLCYRPNRVLIILTLGYVILLASFLALEWRYTDEDTPILTYLILLFGVFLGTYSITDITSHLIINTRHGSDAYAAYEETGRSPCCPPKCFGLWWLLWAIAFQIIGLYLALILMSEECQSQGWFECVFHSRFDLEWKEFDWWPFDDFNK